MPRAGADRRSVADVAHASEGLAKRGPGSEQSTFHGADRSSEHLRDVAVVETLKVPKDQDGPCLEIQKAESPHDRTVEVDGFDAGRGFWFPASKLKSRISLGQPRMAAEFLPPEVRIDAIQRHPDAPGGEPGASIESRQPLVHPHHGVLCDIGRGLRTAKHAETEAVDSALGTLKKGVEGRFRAVSPRLDQFLIGVDDRVIGADGYSNSRPL